MVTPIPVQIKLLSSTVSAVLLLSSAALAESSIRSTQLQPGLSMSPLAQLQASISVNPIHSGDPVNDNFDLSQRSFSAPFSLTQDLAQATPTADLSDLEAGVVAEINRLRTDPAAYADGLQQYRQYFNGTILSLPGETPIQTREGVGTLDEAIAILQNRAPLSALERMHGMSLAAQDHATELGTTGRTSNVGLDGSNASDRLARYGSREGSALELVSYGKTTPEAIVILMILSDGDPNRGYRESLLDSNFGVIGVGCDRHTTQSTVCVMNYSTAYSNNDLAEHIRPTESSTASTEEPEQSVAQQPVQQATEPVVEQPIEPVSDSPVEPATSATTPSQPTATPDIAAVTDSPATDASGASLMSDLERNLIAEVNLLRQDPVAYAEYLRDLRVNYDGNFLNLSDQVRLATREGVAAVDEAIEDLENRCTVLPQLAPRAGLVLSAQDHANDLNENDLAGHIGTDASEPSDRAERYGDWHSIIGENISYAPEQLHNARWHVLQWLIDDGYESRGHRHTLLRPEYQVTGVSCTSHPSYGYVCVMNYADDYTSSDAIANDL